MSWLEEKKSSLTERKKKKKNLLLLEVTEMLSAHSLLHSKIFKDIYMYSCIQFKVYQMSRNEWIWVA